MEVLEEHWSQLESKPSWRFRPCSCFVFRFLWNRSTVLQNINCSRILKPNVFLKALKERAVDIVFYFFDHYVRLQSSLLEEHVLCWLDATSPSLFLTLNLLCRTCLKKKLKIIKSCVKMCHFYCFMFNFCLLPGDTGPLGGAGLHRQHPRRGAVQSPSAIFWQPAASSTVVATGRKGPEQTSVAWWRPWSGHHQTHQLAYNLPASYRHHRGRPWQVQTTNRPAYRLTWLQPEVSCAFSFLAIVFHQDNLLCCFTLFWLRMILNLWLFCWIPYIIWSSTSLFSLMAVLVAICWGISPSSPYYYFTSMAINTLHISCFLSATVLERIAASVKVCYSGF